MSQTRVSTRRSRLTESSLLKALGLFFFFLFLSRSHLKVKFLAARLVSFLQDGVSNLSVAPVETLQQQPQRAASSQMLVFLA